MSKILFLILVFSLHANQSDFLLDWNEAIKYCNSQNLVLPNRDKLEKMKETGKLKSISKDSDFFWSSSVGNGGFSNGAWLVGTGEIIYSYQVKVNKHNVICIKKGDNNE